MPKRKNRMTSTVKLWTTLARQDPPACQLKCDCAKGVAPWVKIAQ